MALVTQIVFRLDGMPYTAQLAMWACAGVFVVSFVAGFGLVFYMMSRTGYPRSWNDLWAANNLGWARTAILVVYAGLAVSFVALMLLTMMFGHRVS